MNIEINGRYFMPYDYEHEVWKKVKGYKNYYISNCWRVKHKDGYIVKPQIFNVEHRVYYYVMLNEGLVRKRHNLEDVMIANGFKSENKIHNDDILRYRKNSEFIYDCF